MANENFIVTSLPAYVEQQRPVLVKDIVFGTPTVSRIVPQTGIKTTAKINYISADPVLQDGSNCGWSPQNTTELTQREIATAIIKVNEEYCPDTLLGKWAEWNVRIPETQRENLPFEGYVLQILSNSIKNKIEKLVWQGNKLSLDADLKWIDGFIKIASTEAAVTDVAIASDASAWNAIKAVIAALPNDVIRRGDVRVFVAPELYLAFVLDMVEKNFFHYSGPQDAYPEEIVFPGTNVRIVSTAGLSETKYILATNRDNMYYGCDVENADEMFKVSYDERGNTLGVAVRWNMGVQFAFPNRVVLGHIGTIPPSPSSGSASA